MSKKVRQYEDFEAWQKAMDLAVAVYTLSSEPPLSRDFELRNQMRSAAISIPSNIAEGFERGTRAEFHRFLTIAKASCAELRTQIELARRVKYITDEVARVTLNRANEVARRVGKLRITVAKQRDMPLMPHASFPMPDHECSSKT